MALVGAKIRRSLECDGAKFRAQKDAEGKSGYALVADGLEAGGSVFLRRVEATGEVRLAGAKLGGDLDCIGATLRAESDVKGEPGCALCVHGARVSGTFQLRAGATLVGGLELTAADLGTINDEAQSWPAKGDLRLDRCTYRAFVGRAPVDAKSRLDWLGRQDPARWGADFWPQSYQQLAAVLREMGHDDEAKTVLVAKERARRGVELRRLPRWRKPSYWGFTQLLRMVGYGYRPALALIPALAVVYAGAAVVKRGWEIQALVRAKPAETAAAAPAQPATPPGVRLVPLGYSFEAFVPVVKLGQVEAFRPDMEQRWGWWLQVYLWGHGFLGWLIGGIAVAGILGLFRRE